MLYKITRRHKSRKIRAKLNSIGCYCTWNGNPVNSMMVHFLDNGSFPDKLYYRPAGTDSWQEKELYKRETLNGVAQSIKWYKLNNLQENTVYEVRLERRLDIHKFKTMPETYSEIKIAMTGDTIHQPEVLMDNLAKGSLQQTDPDVLIISGDIAHDDARQLFRYQGFWDGFLKYGKKSDGCMIPFVTQLGNHDGYVEVNGNKEYLYQHNGATYEDAKWYKKFWSEPGEQGYSVIDVGDYLSIFNLDSGHINTIDGDQLQWLETKLNERENKRLILPCFHLSPYPGFRDYSDTINTLIRNHWTPLFTQYGIKIVHTGHEHLKTISKKVTQESIDNDGALYIGEGASWGTNLRQPSTSKLSEWWVDDIIGSHDENLSRGFWLLTITENETFLEYKDIYGDTVTSLNV